MAVDEFPLEPALKFGTRAITVGHGIDIALADARREAIAMTLASRLKVERTFFGGSVLRQTCGSRRPELDMFVVLSEAQRHYLGSPPAAIVEDIIAALRHSHSFSREKGSARIAVKDPSWQGQSPDRSVRIHVLPAFAATRGFIIPDRWRNEWICVDPAGFDALGRAADRTLPNWRELTRILKMWNSRDGQFEPYIKPGLLIELMVLTFAAEARAPDLGTQLIALFQLMFRRFGDDWPDPAGLAPPLGHTMSRARRDHAREVLEHAWLTLAAAKRLDNEGELREAKRRARSILRKMVPIEPRYEDGELIPRELLRGPKFGKRKR